jgi:isoleucyl-tRNA synthetase
LPFTTEEVWRNLPGQKREPSVHLSLFPAGLGAWRNDGLLHQWKQLRSVREEVNAELERERQSKTISSNLSAHVDLEFDDREFEVLAQRREFLPTLFGVSAVTVTPVRQGDGSGTSGEATLPILRVRVRKADGIKCERCWRYVAGVRTEPDWAGKGLGMKRRNLAPNSRIGPRGSMDFPRVHGRIVLPRAVPGHGAVFRDAVSVPRLQNLPDQRAIAERT